MKYLWKSGDRYTIWSRKYSQTHPDGTRETYVVEKIQVRYPATQQFQKTEMDMKVISNSIQLYNTKSMELLPLRSVHYNFSQSFSGGPGPSGGLDGFCTGQMIDVYQDKYPQYLAELRKRGFKKEIK